MAPNVCPSATLLLSCSVIMFDRRSIGNALEYIKMIGKFVFLIAVKKFLCSFLYALPTDLIYPTLYCPSAICLWCSLFFISLLVFSPYYCIKECCIFWMFLSLFWENFFLRLCWIVWLFILIWYLLLYANLEEHSSSLNCM